MGLLGRLLGRDTDDGQPPLPQAWAVIGSRLGLEVVSGERSVRASGEVRGRRVEVVIEGRQVGSQLLRSFAPTHRNRVHELWTTELWVSCAAPPARRGSFEVVTDVTDPGWEPGAGNAAGRTCRFDPPELEAAVPRHVIEWLWPRWIDVRFDVTADAVRYASGERSVREHGGYFVGSPVHTWYPDAPQPWPERALAGPPFWIGMLCDVADAVEAT